MVKHIHLTVRGAARYETASGRCQRQSVAQSASVERLLGRNRRHPWHALVATSHSTARHRWCFVLAIFVWSSIALEASVANARCGRRQAWWSSCRHHPCNFRTRVCCECKNAPGHQTPDGASKHAALPTEVAKAVELPRHGLVSTGRLAGRLVHFDAADAGEAKPVTPPEALANGQRRPGTHFTNGMPGTFFVIAVPHIDGHSRPTKPEPDDNVASAEMPIMAYQNGQLIPHAICIEAGQSVAFKNETPRDVLVQLDYRRTVQVPAFVGTELSGFPEKLDPYVIRVVSEPGAPRGLVLALGYPYRMTTANADGSFTLSGLAIGNWDLEIWHDTDGGGAAIVRHISRVSLPAKAVRGGMLVRIDAGENHIGEIGLSDADLRKWTFSFPWPF